MPSRERRRPHKRRPYEQPGFGADQESVLGAALGAPAIISARAQSKPGITDELVKAAQKEGVLSYTITPISARPVSGPKTFSKRFGIQMKNMRLPSYPLFDRWSTSSRVGRHLADLIQITDPTPPASYANQQGFVANYVPEGGSAIPATLREDGIW